MSFGTWACKLLMLALICAPVLTGCDDEGNANPIASSYLDEPKAGTWTDEYLGTVIGGEAKDLEWLDLLNVFPNPFNPETHISFVIPENERVLLWIVQVDVLYDPLEESNNIAGGQVVIPPGYPVRVLVDGVLEAAPYIVSWNGTDSFGNKMPSGVYRLYLVAGDQAAYKDLYLLWRGVEYPL